MSARTVTTLAAVALTLATLTAGCSSTQAAPTAASTSLPACRPPEPATLPDAAGSLTEADSGAFCLAVGQVLDVFLTAPANAAAGVRWRQISVGDTTVVGYGNSGILTPPVNVTPGVFDALHPGATTLSSSLPDGTAWKVTIVVK
jgi:hypothetical protein